MNKAQISSEDSENSDYIENLFLKRADHVIKTIFNFYNIDVTDWLCYCHYCQGATTSKDIKIQKKFELMMLYEDDFRFVPIFKNSVNSFSIGSGSRIRYAPAIRTLLLIDSKLQEYKFYHGGYYRFPTSWLFEDFEEDLRKSLILSNL